jgi:excisionase family DNA binding protein
MSLPTEKNFLTISEASSFLNTSPDTLRRLEGKGKIKPKRGAKNERLYSADEILLLQGFIKKGSPGQKRYSIKEAANLLDVSSQTIRRWEKQGKIKPKRTPGGHRYFTYKEIRAIKDNGFRSVVKPEIKIPPQEPVRIIQPLPLGDKSVLFFNLKLMSFVMLSSLLIVIAKGPSFISEQLTLLQLNISKFQTQISEVSREGGPAEESFVSVLSSSEGLYEGDVQIIGQVSISGQSVFEESVKFLKGAEFGSSPLIIDDAGNLSTDEEISTQDLIVKGTTNLSVLSVAGNQIINSSGKIPALNGYYFEDLNGENITNVDAHRLNGVASSSFLRSDQADTAGAVIDFTASPGSSDVNGGSIYINPLSTTTNYTLFGVALGGSQRFKIDAEGDIASSGNFQMSSTGKQFKLSTNTSDPTALGSGSLYFNTSSSRLRVYTGSTWSDISGDITGSGTANYLVKWSDSNTLGDSVIQEVSDQIGIGVSPSQKLDIDGDIRIRGGEIYLDAISSSSSTTEGTIYFDSDDKNLYIYKDGAYSRVGSDLTKYTDSNASLADGSYLEVAHNKSTNDLAVTAWYYDSILAQWRAIENTSATLKQSLQNEFDDAPSGAKTRSETVGEVGGSYIRIQQSADVGNGADGTITVSSSKDITADNMISGRTCADGGDAVNYSVTALSANTATLSSSPSVGCLSAGDEVLLINLQGTSSATANVGNYETLRVYSVATDTVTFVTNKTNYYGDNAGSDANIGTASSNQRVMLQRIPNYTTVTINAGGTITASAWNGTKGGVVAFRANTSTTVNSSGEIEVNALGFDGGPTNSGDVVDGVQGESYNKDSAARSQSANLGGGGGGCGNGTYCGGAGGGGYGGSGSGGSLGSSCSTTGEGGETYGDSGLVQMFLGSGGGAGGHDSAGEYGSGGAGGRGGGIIFIATDSLSVSGSIASGGSNGSAAAGGSSEGGGGGGGSGGSIRIVGRNLSLGSVIITAPAGSGGSGNNGGGNGGAGGVGRIAVFYTSLTGSSSPAATETEVGYYPYGIYHSVAIPTPNSTLLDSLWWESELDTYGKVSFQTRTGDSTDPTDGSWEDWKPFTDSVNYVTVESADTHTNWSGTDATVAEGDVTRDIDFFEDEDEGTAGNVTKITSSTNGGYAEATISLEDISGYDYLTFWVRASQTGNTLKVGFGESAGDEQEEEITIDSANTWQKVYWDLSDIASASRNAVTKLRLTNLTTASNTIYLDNIRAELLMSNSEGTQITSTPADYIQYRAILTTTDIDYIPQLENVSLTYKSGYRIQQPDNDTVRLYNFTGETQNVRLDVLVFGADLAEWYATDDESIEAGDVVIATGEKDNLGVPEIAKTSKRSDNNAIGIISTRAGKELGLPGPNRRLVALSGRVPVKIDPNSPTISVGNFITTSDTPGYARKAEVGDYYVGKALDSWEAGSDKQTVNVFLSLGFLYTDLDQNIVDNTEPDQEQPEADSTNTDYSYEERVKLIEEDLKELKEEVSGLTDLYLSSVSLNESEDNLDSSSVNSLLVLGKSTLGDTFINGKLNVGLLSFDDQAASIDALGTLEIQPLRLGSIKFVGGLIEMEKDGNLNIKQGVVIGNENIRDVSEISPGQTSVAVQRNWENPPVSIVVTPSYNTQAWITEITSSGFVINVENSPEDTQKIFWWAIW